MMLNAVGIHSMNDIKAIMSYELCTDIKELSKDFIYVDHQLMLPIALFNKWIHRLSYIAPHKRQQYKDEIIILQAKFIHIDPQASEKAINQLSYLAAVTLVGDEPKADYEAYEQQGLHNAKEIKSNAQSVLYFSKRDNKD